MTTAAELLDWLGRNQFLTPAQVDELRATLSTYPDATALARALLRRDWLSAFQANQILQGKGEQLILGRYRLRERIAGGAMGQIFKAWSTRLGRVVAVKMIHKGLLDSGKTLGRFLREIEAAAQLEHPNIVRVLDADEFDGQPLMVMEFIDGTDLSRLVKQQGPLPIRAACEFVRQAALGIQHAHDRGVIHRDVKPSNLLLTEGVPGQPPVVKILDFGLARIQGMDSSGPRLTQMGHILGTIDYIAPEQAQDAANADGRADVYSLGCTLYYLLTGQPPFGGTTVVEKIGARLLEEPPRLRAVLPTAPAGLEDVLRQMMARRPQERIQTPAEVAAALGPFTIPLAAPVAAPAAGAAPAAAIPLARPVLPGAALAAGTVPLAQPIVADSGAVVVAALPLEAAEPPLEAPPSEPSVDDAAHALPPQSHVSPAPMARRRPFTVWLGTAAALLLTLVVGFLLLRGLFSASPSTTKGYGPDAAVHITAAFLSSGKDPVRPGDLKRILVHFKRRGFEGPVTLRVEGLNGDFTATPTDPIPGKKETGEIPLMVQNWAKSGKVEFRIVASAEELRDTKRLSVTVIRPK